MLVAAALTRFLCLDLKPIHFDESINGWFVLGLRKTGFYKYDPENYHGPLFFYMLELWTRLFGHGMAMTRALPSLFSFLAIPFFWKRSPWTSLGLLFSGSMIFYGRSTIHESTFVLAQMFFFVGLYEYRLRQRLMSLWWALLGLAMMMTLKETFVFTGLAAVLALHWDFPWKKFFKDIFTEMKWPLLFFIFAVVVLFAGFGHDPAGVPHFFKAFALWFRTGMESGHNKAFWFWTELAWKTEPVVCVGALLALGGVFVRSLRAPSLFALFTWLIYSCVPYKTPWCMMTWAWPFYFVLGLWMDRLWQNTKWRLPLAVACVIFACANMKAAWPSLYASPLDLNHPFVYVNSTNEFKKMDDAIQKVLRERPELRREPIQISLDETWPMPWTLQDSDDLNYYHVSQKIIPDALVYFCETTEVPLLDKELDKEGRGRYVTRTMPLRQYGREVKIYLRADVFSEFP